MTLARVWREYDLFKAEGGGGGRFLLLRLKLVLFSAVVVFD